MVDAAICVVFIFCRLTENIRAKGILPVSPLSEAPLVVVRPDLSPLAKRQRIPMHAGTGMGTLSNRH